jgi:streptomycin 6-kinase
MMERGYNFRIMKRMVPDGFSRAIEGVFGQEGREWLERLPGLVELCVQRWSLTVEGAFAELSYNYVLRVRRADGSRAVLKLGVPEIELSSEIAALQFYAGRGSAYLYESDADLGALLIEALEPGDMLATQEDDERATMIAAGVMEKLWRPATADWQGCLSVAGWASGIQRLRKRFGGGSGPLPEKWLGRAEGLFGELLASAGPAYLLHGDLHHFNILRAQREPWLAIDPKGVLGEPAYELGAFLYNPQPDFPWRSDLGKVLARRVALLCERLGLDRQRVLGYGVAQAVLSACWDIEGNVPRWEGMIRVAEELANL